VHGAELVCASVEFGIGDENPLLRALPDLLHTLSSSSACRWANSSTGGVADWREPC
jgi:hypothetical protein